MISDVSKIVDEVCTTEIFSTIDLKYKSVESVT